MDGTGGAWKPKPTSEKDLISALYSFKNMLCQAVNFVDVMFGMAISHGMDLSAVGMTKKKWSLLFFGNGNVRSGYLWLLFAPIFFWTKNQTWNLKWEHPIGVIIWPTKSSSKIPTQLRYSEKPGDLAHRNGYAGVTSHFAVRDPDGWPPENWGMTIVKPSKHIFIQRTGVTCEKGWLLLITFSNDLVLSIFSIVHRNTTGSLKVKTTTISRPQLSSEKQRRPGCAPWGQRFRGDILSLSFGENPGADKKKQQPGWVVQKLLENPIIFASQQKNGG